MFSSKIIILSSGRVSSARMESNGDISFKFEVNGALVEKKIPRDAKQISLRVAKTVSYADDCYKLIDGYLHRRGGFSYERK